VKHDPDGLAKQKDLRQLHGKKREQSIQSNSPETDKLDKPDKAEKSTAPSSKKRAIGEEGPSPAKKPSLAAKTNDETSGLKVSIPDALLSRLVEDWQSISKSQKLLRLPAEVTVSDLLGLYRDYRLSDPTIST
jgi:hypothetical protein